MKKLLLMSVVVLVSSLSLQAQNFDEANLVGKWERSTAMLPVDNYLVSIDTLYLGNNMWSYKENDGNTETRYASGIFYGQWQGAISNGNYEDKLADNYNTTWVLDFSITNGDKLHIGLSDDFTLIFKILSLTSTELVIQPLGSSNQIRFQKISNPTGINSAKISSLSGGSTIYDMTGKKLSKKNKGVNIIKPNNGTAYKEIVK